MSSQLVAAKATSSTLLPHYQIRGIPEQQEDARRNMAYAFIGAYLVLLLTNIVVPIVLFATSVISVSDMKDVTLSISAALGNLVGILGVVVGFYFKSIDDQKEKKKAKALASTG